MPVRRRVAIDGNRITASGVSAGIDMALLLAGMLWGEAVAQDIQLGMEYAPEPPYNSGTPEAAPAGVLAAYKERTKARQKERAAAEARAAKALGEG